ncbi:hypothetical protein LCGC14_0663630 [marine sediment metagenome]|uniref:Uncharacterized protein n=1 Tax=marine sediment metagenome TaxID=412755 RepID=A0A0F9QSY4_9ZZZZ
MKKKKRRKSIPFDEIKNFLSKNCVPVRLEGEAIPSTFKNLVKKKKCFVFASGFQDVSSGNYDPDYTGIRFGGIQIYRDARSDPEPYLFNVDGYSIITDSTTGIEVDLIGPTKTLDHWTNIIASGLTGAEVNSHKFPKCPNCGNIIYDTAICNYCGWQRHI